MPMRERFVAAGWAEQAVAVVDFDDRYGGNTAHAAEVAGAVDGLRVATGADAVDIVAHSMGGLAVRVLLAESRRAALIRRVVFLATPHSGTWAALLAWGDGGREMRPGSELLRRLGRHALPGHVRGLTVRTPVDLRILPGASAHLDGTTRVEVCCPSHRGLLRSEKVFALIAGALTGATPENDGTAG